MFSIIDLVEKRFTQIPEYGEDQQQEQQQDQQQLQQQEKQNRQQQQQQPPPSISNPTNSTRYRRKYTFHNSFHFIEQTYRYTYMSSEKVFRICVLYLIYLLEMVS